MSDASIEHCNVCKRVQYDCICEETKAAGGSQENPDWVKPKPPAQNMSGKSIKRKKGKYA